MSRVRNPLQGPSLTAALVVLAMLSAGPTSGEETGLETRVFTVRYKAVEDALLLIRPLLGDDASVTLQPRLRTLAVTDEPARLDRVAGILTSFDVPPRRVTLAVSLILGTRSGRDGEVFQRARPPRTLPGFDSTVRALEHTVWTDYRLLGSASFATSEGEESELTLGEDYRIRLRVDSVNPEEGVTRFDRFSLERRTPGPREQVEFRPVWNTVLNLRDDQLYVFGATRMEDSQRAIFLSVTAGIER